jgi:hypothetical protein
MTLYTRSGSLEGMESGSTNVTLTDVPNAERRAYSDSDLIADSVLQTLDLFGMERGPVQRQQHLAFFNSCLPQMYGADAFEHDRTRILQRFGFTEHHRETLAVTPRRSGKTYGLSMFVAAMLWCVPDVSFVIFSTGQRAATNMLHLIEKWCMHLRTPLDDRVKLDKSVVMTDPLYITVTVRNREAGTRDIRRCYSSTCNGLFVSTKNPPIVCFDETSRLPEPLYEEVFLPALGNAATTVLSCSTCIGADDHAHADQTMRRWLKLHGVDSDVVRTWHDPYAGVGDRYYQLTKSTRGDGYTPMYNVLVCDGSFKNGFRVGGGMPP